METVNNFRAPRPRITNLSVANGESATKGRCTLDGDGRFEPSLKEAARVDTLDLVDPRLGRLMSEVKDARASEDFVGALEESTPEVLGSGWSLVPEEGTDGQLFFEGPSTENSSNSLTIFMEPAEQPDWSRTTFMGESGSLRGLGMEQTLFGRWDDASGSVVPTDEWLTARPN